MNSKDYIILPVDADFSDTKSELSYDGLSDNEIARVNYYYSDTYVGSASIEPAVEKIASFDFGPRDRTKNKELEEEEVMIVNVKMIIKGVVIVAIVFIVLFSLKAIIFKGRGSRRRRKNTKKNYRTINTRDLDWKGFK